MVEKLLGARIIEDEEGADYPPWSEWLPLIQCKLGVHTITFYIDSVQLDN